MFRYYTTVLACHVTVFHLNSLNELKFYILFANVNNFEHFLKRTIMEKFRGHCFIEHCFIEVLSAIKLKFKLNECLPNLRILIYIFHVNAAILNN